MSDQSNHIQNQLETTSNMLSWINTNFSEISAMEEGDKLAVMARLQYVQAQIKTSELRMREELIYIADPEEGKSKTLTNKEIGYKIECKRPVSSKFYPKVKDAEFRKALGVKQAELNDMFPTSRSFSKTAYNQLSEEQQKGLTECMDVKLGQIAVKVTAL